MNPFHPKNMFNSRAKAFSQAEIATMRRLLTQPYWQNEGLSAAHDHDRVKK